MSSKRPDWRAWACLGALLGACAHPTKETTKLPAEAPLVRSFGRVPLGRLVDQDGTAFGPKEVAGHVWITALMFTSCEMACPAMAERMRYLQTLLPTHAPSIRLLSITVDPETDNPTVLSRYGARFHRDASHWTFVTGETEPLFDVVSATYKRGPEGAGGRGFDHGETLVLIDGTGKIAGYYRKDDESVKRLLADADRLADPLRQGVSL